MQFNEESLLPARQGPLIITAVPFWPQTTPTDTASRSPFTLTQQVQVAVDCMKAGASILHVSACDPDTGLETSDPLQVSTLLTMLRRAAPKLLLQIDGPRLAPPYRAALWSEREPGSMIEDLTTKPDFVTIDVYAPAPRSAKNPVR